jgi:glycosyltransferase involved in cell wall biosynthesis
MTKVSVLIPTYNCGAFLDEALQSVLNQTFLDYECVIVDNCSTDNTEAVVAKYFTDPRIKYYKNTTNIGLVGNWNKCLEYAQGEYIKYLCADDTFYPDALEKMVSVMEENPTVSLVIADKEFFGSINKIMKMPFEHLVEGREVIYETLRTFDFMGDPTVVMFRSSNLKLGPFRDQLWVVDWEMWIRQLTVGDAYFIPETLTRIRKHPDQATNKLVVKNFVHRFAEYEFFKNLKEKNEYNLELYKFHINKTIKKKAKALTKDIVYRQLPIAFKEKDNKIFKKAIKIAIREKVLLSTLLEMIGNALRHLAPSYNRKIHAKKVYDRYAA